MDDGEVVSDDVMDIADAQSRVFDMKAGAFEMLVSSYFKLF